MDIPKSQMEGQVFTKEVGRFIVFHNNIMRLSKMERVLEIR